MKTWTSVAVCLACLVFAKPTRVMAVEDAQVWHEFARALEDGSMSIERIRPYQGLSAETLLGWLKTLGAEVPHEQLAAIPEMYHVGDLLHYLLALPEVTYCLTFVIEGDAWYFRHIENVFIRLDRIDSIPASRFPDILEEQKAWIREENYWSQIVYLYGLIAADKGEQVALNMLRDGAGYFLAAKTWVPFVEPRRAFVLYTCWEQANLRGNGVTLEHLTDDSATIRFSRLHFFELYEHSIHLREQIPVERYRRIFETIWQDRAVSAGWELQLEELHGNEWAFHLTKAQ